MTTPLDPPTLPAIRRRGGLAVWCVYCDRWHHHGTEGHVWAHCARDTPYTVTGYVVAEIRKSEVPS